MVGYDTMCRRSELAALRIDGLTSQADGSQLALIRRAKNDPFGDGRDGFVSAAAADALKAWLEAASISEGWLFRRVHAGRIGSDALHPHSIGRILKQRASAAGLPAEVAKRLSGHSTRVGAAQDMAANGADILPIMCSDGWKSINVVARYVQNVELGRLAAWLKIIRALVSMILQYFQVLAICATLIRQSRRFLPRPARRLDPRQTWLPTHGYGANLSFIDFVRPAVTG